MAEDIETQFWRDGYAVVRGVLPAERIARVRTEALKTLETDERAGRVWRDQGARGSKGDLLSKEGLRDLLFEPGILSVLRTVLGGDPVYFGDSSFQIGEGARGWHRDNRDPDRYMFSRSDWEGRYPLIRIGIYLQDHKEHSGGLAIRVGSHLPSRLGNLLSADTLKLRQDLRAAILKRVAYQYGRAILVDSQPGDLVLWNLRTVHSGNAVRFRWAPHLKLPSLIEYKMPKALSVPAEAQRIACFATFAAEGQHLSNYLEYLRSRPDTTEHWRQSSFGKDVWEQARARGLHIVKPIDAYGAPAAA